MRALTPRSRLQGEGGASMAIILALIAILALCVGAIATQGTAGMLAVQGVKNQRADVYGAEGAIDAAINYMRGDLTRGRIDTSKCDDVGHFPNDPNKVIFTAPSDVGAVKVTCKSFSGSGEEVEGLNYPENAILTTSGLAGYPAVDTNCSGDPGICVTGNSNGKVTVDGSVKSNATSAGGASIVVTSGTLDAGDDAVRATGTCSGNIIGEPKVCGTGVTRADPGGAANEDKPASHIWGAELQTLPAQAPNPTCNTTTRIATMTPGSYFSRDALIGGFSSGSTNCTVVWMQPGLYYFDFEFNENDGAEDSDEADGLWRIGHDDLGRAQELNAPGRVVIGGTRTCNPSPGFCWGNSTTAAQVLAAFPNSGACDKTAANGVQTVFGGDTTYDVKDYGKLELCPYPNSSRQQIAVYGRKTTQVFSQQNVIFKATGVTSPGPTPSTLGSPAPNVFTIGDGLSNSGTQTGNSRTNILTLGGFAPNVTLPTYSTLESLKLRVAHQETTSPSSGSVTITAKITRGDGSSPSSCSISSSSSGSPFNKRTTMTTQEWTVPTSCIDSVSELTGAKVQWDVTGPSGSSSSLTSRVDGIQLEAEYTPRGMRAKDPGSLITWMYGPWNDKQPQIYIWGTVYAPTSRIDLETAGVTTTIARFGRGVVVAALEISDLNVNQPYVAFANVSGVRHYTDRLVELIAYVDGRPMLRVVVRFDDNDPSAPGKIIDIDRWNAVT